MMYRFNLWWRTDKKSCVVLVHLDAGIFVLLCNGTLYAAQAERRGLI